MLTYAQWRIEVVGVLLYTQVFVAFLSIQALLRLFLAIQGSIKALSRPHPWSTRRHCRHLFSLLRLYEGFTVLRLY
jgi:hypothetical protein